MQKFLSIKMQIRQQMEVDNIGKGPNIKKKGPDGPHDAETAQKHNICILLTTM